VIGTTISHYRILEKLGEGGMGVVYKAQDLKLDRLVALKFLPYHLSASSDAVARFLQEAKAASALNHPNICTIHSIEDDDGRQFIVMECVDGVTLRQKIQTELLDLRSAIEYAIQIADGLAKAHEKGIVHRDIKSDNIMVTRDGLVKIMDFGLAKLRGVSSLTKYGSTVGTLGYMSPEQLHGLDPDHRTDIYAFGVLFFEMITGKLPFQGAHEAAIMYEIANAIPPAPSTLRTEVDPRVEKIVFLCLAKEREIRPQSIQGVATELREIRGSTSVSVGGPAISQQHAPGWLSRRTIMWIALAGLIIIGAVAAAMLLSRPEEAIDSIAVLPFTNQSRDPDTEYLSDGITEQIMNKLSQIPTIRVIPRSTVFTYKGKENQAQKAGEELKVKAVLVGRVLQRGDNLTVQTELIDVRKQAQLWGEQYNRKMTDILELQEDIAKQISSNLRLRLTGEEKRKLVKRYTENTEAYQLYLKGNFLIQKATPEGLTKGLELMNQALKLDPNFALPYIGRAYYYSIATDFYIAPNEAMPEFKKDASKALDLDQENSEAHTWLAWYYAWYAWDWSESEKEFRRALELNPNSYLAHEWFTFPLIAQQRTEEALQQARKAVELEPLSPEVQAVYALMLIYAHRYEDSFVQLQKVTDLDPDYPFASLFLGFYYTQQGKPLEASRAYQRSLDLFAAPWCRARVAYGYAKAGRKAEALAILDTLRNQSQKAYVASDIVASVYVALGDKEKAFEYLEKGYQERAGWMIWLKVDPIWDPIRSDPRLDALLKRMKLQ
jgi:serine/threonine protein kinase/Tfp pilus assembly protein PilF